MYTRILAAGLAVVALSGCAVGQRFNYASATINTRGIELARSASVAVLDRREYVVSGDKPESFVGLSRGGYGNPFDVTTESKKPRAHDMALSITAALQGKGLEVRMITVDPKGAVEGARQALVQSGSDRLLLFTINEWKTDTMMRTGLHFDVSLDVFDRDGNALARSQVSGKEVSGSSIVSAEKDAQNWFAAKMRELLGDQAVRGALR